MDEYVQRGSSGEAVGGCAQIRRVLERTVGKFTGGEAEADLGPGRQGLLEIQSNFSRMEGHMSRGKDKQTN